MAGPEVVDRQADAQRTQPCQHRRAAHGVHDGGLGTLQAQPLRRDAAGELQLIFPTRRTLERLAQHATFDAMVADARRHPIEPISPWLDEVDGERFVTIPEGIGYPVTRERLEGLWRG